MELKLDFDEVDTVRLALGTLITKAINEDDKKNLKRAWNTLNVVDDVINNTQSVKVGKCTYYFHFNRDGNYSHRHFRIA